LALMSSIAPYLHSVVTFVETHQAWAAPIVFVLAFGESLAFFSLLLPATVLLVGIGALIGASGLDFWSIWSAAVVGAALGDWLSYWIGYHYADQIAHMWPLRKYPDLLPRAHALFEKWGPLAVFFGRFSGPVRATVPLVAGAAKMDRLPFQLANWLSAFVWSTGLLAPGVFGAEWVTKYLVG
jgi:membrane protein DedA with SNARE-associated domain